MRNFIPRLRAGAAVVCLGLLAATAAQAQSWPTKPIRIIVPAPPGAITDGVARLVADHLQTNVGQPVIVENKPGGSAVIAERAAATPGRARQTGTPHAPGHTPQLAPYLDKNSHYRPPTAHINY